MSDTPARRGPGGFPTTPQTWNRSPGVRSPNAATPSRPNVRSPLPDVPRAASQNSGPLIPSDILDPAQQRFYVFAIYIALWAYRSYDFYTLAIEDDQSLLLCLKWVFFDMLFMFGIPLFEIPWLEWSNSAAFLLFVLHAALDVMLMFRIGIPVQAWFLSFVGFLWDSEMAISERSVKPGAILHNASLILGKQIVNILPEGSAILNPNKEPFCLSSSITQLEIPILINQTEPIEMELWRIDIETNVNETITIKNKELKGMLKKARKSTKSASPDDPLMLKYVVKKPGVYLLRKVLDHSKLLVRPRASSLIVTTCPQARVKPTGEGRCRNDLSNVALEVEGTPPLNIKYRLTVNGKPRGGSQFQNLQLDDVISPLSRHTSQALVKNGKEDVSWAKVQKITVPLNETLSTSGRWEYEMEEVQDGLGNLVNFLNVDDDDRPKVKYANIRQSFEVHERPKVFLQCNPQSPLRVAKGDVTRLPVHYGSTGKEPIESAHAIEYLFSPEVEIIADGYHSPNAVLKKQTMRSIREQPLITDAGLYTIKSVSTDLCEGEVLEPTSCLLQNPPEPNLALSSDDIVDKCAGNPIGLQVGLDLVGTPPFTITYFEQKDGGRRHRRELQIATLRSTIPFTPEEAGHYKYTFEVIRDAVYKDRPLRNLELQQNVRPSAQARFMQGKKPQQACIDDSVEFDVRLSGEAPWKLEYELVHNGKRTKHTIETDEEHYTIRTAKLKNGGEYVLALTSVSDKMGCKEFLKDEEARVRVRHERPKAYFGHIEGKQAILALEGRAIGLPLRFTGEGPWRVEYENLDTNEVKKENFQDANSFLDVNAQGTYQLLSVRDNVCPGLIEEKASQFQISWVARPTISIPESTATILDGEKYVKEAVCEGDEDAFEVALHGNAPFDVSYRQEYKDKKGKTAAVSEKDVHTASGAASIRADTSKSGVYEYTFMKLADSRYDYSKKHFTPVTIQQTVHSRPGARFDKPGKTYSYCSREAEGEEVIPITLEGIAPFYLEVEIKHHGTPKPEISVHKNIPTPKFDLKIEHRKLHLGHSSISIRKVRDARGCTLKPPTGGPRVSISVHDAPTATALEDRTDFCVGERLSFALGGQVPFTVYYTFEAQERKASNAGTTFRRLAELPGTFTITGLRDSASECLAALDLPKTIHPIPSVRLSGGQVSEVDIHEGGGTDLEFEFWGTPPFEFTYTRSTNAGKGRKSRVLEIRTEISHEHRMGIAVQEEGTYEVVSIKDRWCSFARSVEGVEGGKGAQKVLTY